MSTQVEPRVEVGQCDLGYVVIIHKSSGDGDTWQVRAGNHTIGTYDSEERANAVAIALCGQENLNNAFVAEVAPVPQKVDDAMDTYAAAVRAKVSRK